MAMAFVFCALVVAVAADCQTSALTAFGNPAFNWLLSPPADQQTKLTQICNPADLTSRNQFNAVLNDLQTNCVTTVNGTTSPTQLIFQVLQGILCKKIDGQLCGLGVFAMFDTGYFYQIQSAAQASVQPPLPNISFIMSQADRAAALCASDVCNSAIEQYTSTYSQQALLNSDASGKASTQAAVNFVTKLVNRPRCGCFKSGGTHCFAPANLNSLEDVTALKAAACDPNNAVLPCGRALMTCDQLGAPTCTGTPTCNSGYNVEFDLDIKNLDKVCYFAAMTAVGSAINTIAADLAINLIGTIKGDYTIDCPQTNPDKWVSCKIKATCVTFGMFNENQILQKIKTYSDKFAATSLTLDGAVGPSCRVDPSIQTYGESIVFKVTIVTPGGAAALGVCLPLLALLAFFA